jgi:hypothetical protein
MAQLIKIKSGSSGAAPGSLLTGEPAYSINDNKLYIGNGSSVVRVDAGSYTGECSTAAATGAKTVSCAGFILFPGVEITVKFTVTNTAAVSGLTLNVGGTGAKPIRYRGTYLLSPSTLSKNRVYKFYYGGNNWELIGDLDIDTTVATELASHTDNSEIHITSTERTNWNAAYSWGNHASAGYAAASALSSHTGKTSNPHSVTKSQVGLGNVLNVASYSKTESDTNLTSAISAIEIGGRNLIIGSYNDWRSRTVPKYGYSSVFIPIQDDWRGKTVTHSFEVKDIPEGESVRIRIDYYRPDTTYTTQYYGSIVSLSGKSFVSYTVPTDIQYNRIRARIYPANYTANYNVLFRSEKLEFGNKATDWTPAPEDVDASIALVQTNLNTHTLNTSNPHAVTTAQIGAVDLTTNQTIGGNKSFSNYLQINGRTTIDGHTVNIFLSGSRARMMYGESTTADRKVAFGSGWGTIDDFAVFTKTSGSFSEATQRFTVKMDGNVGIGTTSPAYKLDVSGTGRFTSTLTATTAKLTNLTNGYIPYHVSDASGLANSVIFTDGTNVGIGYTAPGSYRLKVNGSGYFNSNLSVGGTLGVTGNTTLSGTLGVTGATTLSTAYATKYSAGYIWSSASGGYTCGVDGALNGVSFYNGADTSARIYRQTNNLYINRGGVIANGLVMDSSGNVTFNQSINIPTTGKYLQIGSARLTYEVVEGVGFLKLAHSNDTTPMHLVTTGGQTMYSTGVPAAGGGGGAIIQVNNVTYGEGSTAKIYSPTGPGTPGYILKAADPSGLPEWEDITDIIPWGGLGNAKTVARSDHNHSGVYAAASHAHSISQIYNFPTSMPASDVYAWAKEAAKPTYSYSEISATPTALKNPYSITLQAAGTSLGSYNGSSAKTFNITYTNIGAAAASHNHTGVYAPASHTHSYVPTTRTVNNRELSSNITLSPQDVGAAAAGHTHSYLPLSGGTVTGSLSVNTLSITNTSAASHLAFGRGSYNYITMPASGLLGILPNGQSVGAGSGMWFSSSGLHPGTNNTFMVGTSSKRFSQVHATTIYEAGTALSSKYAASSHTHSYVPTTRKVNTKALSSDITLSHTDVGAAAASHTHSGYAAANHEHETITGILAVGKGGTGATTPAGALNKLGAAAASHTHSGYASTSHDHNGVYAAASHNHTTLTSFQGITYVDSNSDPQNILIRTGTGNNDILLGNADHNLTIRGDNVKIETGVSPRAGFWKSDGSGNLSVDTNTYLTGITKAMVNAVGCNADTVDSLHASSFLRSDAANSSDIAWGSTSGRGIRFWNDEKYKIFMAATDNTTYGNRMSGDTTSDYNMYFRIGDGTNRGFVFESSYSVKLASINPDGIRTLVPLTVRSTETSYNNSQITLGNAAIKYLSASDNIEINKGLKFTAGTIQGAVIDNYGVCSTAVGTAAKAVTISGFRLATGVQINVKFSNDNYSYPITLNVSNTGAKTVKAYGDSSEQDFIEQIKAGAVIPFVYDGTYWVIPTTPSMY